MHALTVYVDIGQVLAFKGSFGSAMSVASLSGSTNSVCCVCSSKIVIVLKPDLDKLYFM